MMERPFVHLHAQIPNVNEDELYGSIAIVTKTIQKMLKNLHGRIACESCICNDLLPFVPSTYWWIHIPCSISVFSEVILALNMRISSIWFSWHNVPNDKGNLKDATKTSMCVWLLYHVLIMTYGHSSLPINEYTYPAVSSTFRCTSSFKYSNFHEVWSC